MIDKEAQKVTSRTVAEMAGVSQTTVSRVLNGSPKVSDSARQKVLSIVDNLHYVPNALARDLVTQRTSTIGLVVSNITNPFYPELVEAISSIASHQHLSVILCNTQQDPDRQQEYLRILVEQRVQGIIITSVMMHTPYVQELVKTGYPVVLVNRYLAGAKADAVLVNNYAGAISAVTHLQRLGHSEIVYVQGQKNTSTNRDRQRGYRAAMLAGGSPALCQHILPGNYTWSEAYQAGVHFAQMMPRPSAALCADDITALGFIDALFDHDIDVPGRCAVIGFDDIQASAFRMIGLTTVRQPAQKMAEHAMNLLLDRIGSGYQGSARRVVLPAELIIRRTCGTKRP